MYESHRMANSWLIVAAPPNYVVLLTAGSFKQRSLSEDFYSDFGKSMGMGASIDLAEGFAEWTPLVVKHCAYKGDSDKRQLSAPSASLRLHCHPRLFQRTLYLQSFLLQATQLHATPYTNDQRVNDVL
jgi:hypothetical protein